LGRVHYWYHDQSKGPIPRDVWAGIVADARKIVAVAGRRRLRFWRRIVVWLDYDRPGTGPELSEQQIRLNGAGDLGHEPFVIKPMNRDFDFCKTANKPYATVVTAILAVAAERAPDHLRIECEGPDEPAEEYRAGLALAYEALGRKVPCPVRTTLGHAERDD